MIQFLNEKRLDDEIAEIERIVDEVLAMTYVAGLDLDLQSSAGKHYVAR